jgi:hypothetical protein
LIKRDGNVEIFLKASVKWKLNMVHDIMKGASIVEVAVKWNPITEGIYLKGFVKLKAT